MRSGQPKQRPRADAAALTGLRLARSRVAQAGLWKASQERHSKPNYAKVFKKFDTDGGTHAAARARSPSRMPPLLLNRMFRAWTSLPCCLIACSEPGLASLVA